MTVGKLFNLYADSRRAFSEGALQVVSLTTLCFKWSVKEHCISNILLSIWETFLYKIIAIIIPTNSVPNWLLSLFCPFVETANKNQIFKVSRHVKFKRLLWKSFLICYSCSYCSSMLKFRIISYRHVLVQFRGVYKSKIKH